MGAMTDCRRLLMINSLEDLFQSFVDASYRELIRNARESVKKLLPLFNEIVGEPKDMLIEMANDSVDKMTYYLNEMETKSVAQMILDVIFTTIAVDGRFSKAEYLFICNILDIESSYEDVKKLVETRYTDEGMRALVDMLYDNFFDDDQIRYDFSVLILSILAADEEISNEEVRYFIQLLKQK